MDMETKTTPLQDTAQEPVKEPKKMRRVGTVTFALVLIAAGILLIVYQIMPGFVMRLLKLSPALLVALGVELLIYSAKPDVKVRFDWLSLLGTGFILCVVGTASILPTFWNQYGPGRELAVGRMEAEKVSAFYGAMAANPEVKARIDNIYVDVWFNHASEGEYTLESGDTCQLNLTFIGTYPDAEAFAADCRSVMQTAEQAELGFTKYNFTTDSEQDNENTYGLTCDAAFPAGLTAEQLAQRVWTSYHYDGSSFSSEAERDDYIREQLRWQVIDEYETTDDGEMPPEDVIQKEVDRRMAERFGTATPETAQA